MKKFSQLPDASALNNIDKIVGLQEGENKIFPGTLFKKDNYRGKAMTGTDPGASVAGDYFICGESGTFTNFGNQVANKLDRFVYNGTGWDLFQISSVENPVSNEDLQNSLVGAFYHFDGNNDRITLSPLWDGYKGSTISIAGRAYLRSLSSNNYLLEFGANADSYAGIYMRVNTSGTIRAVVGNGVARNSVDFTKTWDLDQWISYCVTVDLNGYKKLYINGQLVSSIDISALGGTFDDNAGNFNLGAVSDSWDGFQSHCLAWTRELTATEAKEVSTWSSYNSPILYADKDASNTPAYASDFSIGTDGWVINNAVGSGNSDAVSDGSTSRDDVLKYYADASSSDHFLRRDSVTKNAKRYRVDIEYYIPAGQTHVDGFNMQDGYGNTWIQENTVGAWTSKSFEFVDQPGGAGAIYVVMEDGGSKNFTGANNPNDDIIYFSLIKVTPIGCVFELPTSGFGFKTARDMSGNDNHGQVNGAEPVNLPFNHEPWEIPDTFTTDIASGVGSKVLTIPTGYYVDEIQVDDKGTAAGLTNIQATQETSGTNLITGKSVASGEKKSFSKGIADHNIYDSDKNLTFTVTGNGGSGMQISVKFKKA